jgi:NAD(P)-dependent dehydrogenase (short-subunit alcohol dehydrogenase family)
MEPVKKLTERMALEGRVIVLTGATGRYGRGLVADLATTGARLVITSRDPARAREIAAAEVELGHHVFTEPLDLADETSMRELRDGILKRHGQIDGLVNNAVSHIMQTPDSAVEEWTESLKVNGTGLMLMHRTFRDPLRASGHGSIVNIGSIFADHGPMLSRYEGTTHAVPPPDYFFAKGGLLNLTRYYAALYGAEGIRVNCVSPGGYRHNQSEEYVQRYSAHTFLRRMAGDRDLGGAIAFLLSDAAGYITGVNLPVDGGYTAG